MRAHASLFGRAFLQVSLVALNVAQIARGHIGGAFVVGFLISLLWFANAKSAGRSDVPYGAWCYATGAGFGTVAGMLVSRLF